MAADGSTNNFQGLTSILNIRFFNDFFFKRFSKSYWSGNPIDPNIGRDSKKLSESIKSDTKAGKFFAHLYPKKAQIEQKVITVFNENSKEIGPWFIWITW